MRDKLSKEFYDLQKKWLALIPAFLIIVPDLNSDNMKTKVQKPPEQKLAMVLESIEGEATIQIFASNTVYHKLGITHKGTGFSKGEKRSLFQLPNMNKNQAERTKIEEIEKVSSLALLV